MDLLLRSLPHTILHLPLVVVTDANIHSSLWNPDRYPTHDAAGDSLVDAMTKWSLHLRSPKGVITFENPNDPTTGTTIDLVWVNQQADDVIVACVVDEDDVLNHHSDHRALVTVISVKCDTALILERSHPSEKNWHKADQAGFLSELKAHLPPLTRISSNTDIYRLDTLIFIAVTSALNTSSPPKSKPFKHKKW